MFVLQVNPIWGRAEQLIDIAYSDSKEKIETWVQSLTVPIYTEDSEQEEGKVYTKFFKKGSVLEDFNPPSEDSIVELMDKETYLKQLSEKYDNDLDNLKANTFEVV